MRAPLPFKLGLGILGFWPFVPLASRAPTYGRLLLELLRDPRVPLRSKAFIAGAAAYIASPIDLIPDFIPVIGRIDDAAVIVLAVDFFLESVPRSLVVEKMNELGIDGRELERDLESARRAIPRPIRAAMRRAPRLATRFVALGDRELRRRGVLPPRAKKRATANAPREEATA
jgi:uncharacterized membrane protein YkvA (DUF1232 family)